MSYNPNKVSENSIERRRMTDIGASPGHLEPRKSKKIPEKALHMSPPAPDNKKVEELELKLQALASQQLQSPQLIP